MRLLLFIPLLLISAGAAAQTFTMGNLGVVTNACGGVFYDSGGAAGQYGNGQNFTATFCAPAGQYISFDFTSFNTANAQDFLDIYEGPNATSPLIGSFDGANSPGLVTSALGGCLTFVFTSNNSGTAAGWVANISCNVTPPGTGDDCIAALGFCTNNTYTFPNNTDAGDLGAIDCLFATPNPVWYYMQIQSAGTLNMNISQTTNAGVGIDVDFDLWGPFTSLPDGCAAIAAGTATSVDCSFSAAAIEQAVIPNAQVGQFYIILLTNFSNQPGEITFSTAAGSTAATNCNILCGITDVTATPSACVPATNTYSVTGQVLVTNPPTSGNLVISSSCGGSVTIPGPFGSSINYTLTGLVPTGGACNLTASFSADATCNFTQTYLSPNSCSANVLNCPNYASVSTSPSTACAGQVYYLQVANTACNGTINFQVQGNWGLVASGPPPSLAQNASQISWNVTSNLTGGIVASGAGSSTVNGQNFSFNVGPLNPAVVGNLFTLNVFDSNGNGFGSGGNIAVYQNGAAISSIINVFGASSFTQFGANLTISPATITINTPTGPVISTVTNCKNFKVPISLQNTNFCNTVNLALPWTITCSTSGAVISSGVNNVTVYPSIPSAAEDIVDIAYDSLNCDWTVTPLNDCVAANIGSIFTITPNPLTLNPPSCQSGNATFEVVYNGIAGGPNCCATGGPQIPVVFNQSYPQANFSPANSPFGGTNNSAFLTIPPNNIGGVANSLSLSVSINGYCFNPPGAATSGQAPYWVTIIVDGQIVYDQITTNPAPVNNTVSINLANIPNGYSDDSVIQIYIYPNTLTSVTFNPLASCPLPNTPDGIWTAQINATINASFNDNAPTPAVCNYNSLPFHPCCPPNIVANAQSTICSGGSLAAVSAWQNSVALANPSCVVYSSILPVAGSVIPVNTLTGVNLTSTSLVQTLSAYSYCDSDGNGTVNLGDTYTLISTYTLTINPATTVSVASANPTICLGVALAPVITFTTSGATGIGVVNQLPTGLTASWNANIITISGTPVVSGTFNYSIQVLGNCSSVNATGTITIVNSVAPVFAPVGPFCSGASIPALPTISTNSISGSWSPSINNITTTSYTFTPAAGQCATSTNLTITINPNVTPSFNSVGPFCSGSSISPLPSTSSNGIAGTWAPIINNTATTTYTFTPNAGQCATTAPLTITITPNVTPSFASVGPFCSGATIPALPSISTNNITGSWSPSIINTATTTYTFTPAAGQCATSANLTITITPNVTPVFNAVGPFCSGASISPLPATSSNGITGTWSPAINNTATTSYTFTPSVGQCAASANMTIIISDILDYVNLQFPGNGSVCEGVAFNAYGQVYNIGTVNTPDAGQAPGVTVQIGYNLTNTNPSGWTNWVNATFNAQVGNNDEYLGVLAGLAPGVYYYTFRYQINNCGWQYGGYSSGGGGAWGGSNISGVLNVIESPNAGFDGSVSVCASGTPVSLFAALTGSPDNSGSWSGPSALENGALGTYDPILDNPGIYSYTVVDPNNVCPPDNSTVSVNETASPQASVAYAPCICTGSSSSEPPLISGALGGTFTASPSSLVIDPFTGVYNPSTSPPGTYTVTYTIPPINGCSAFQTQAMVIILAPPLLPGLNPANPCSILDSVFTATGGAWYEFFVNGVSTGPASSNNVLDTTALAAGTQVCVRSYPHPPIIDGSLIDAAWTPVIPGTTGGSTSQSPFTIADTRFDGLKMLNRNGLLYFALAGNEIDGTLQVENNRILLFIDSRAGGFNTLSTWVNRSNAPPFTYGVRNLNGGIQFDPGFEADYILCINRANLVGSTTFYDLYDLVSNTNVFLGSSPSAQFGYQESFADNDLTKGFEFYIPLSALGSPVSLEVFGMLVNDPGEFASTLVSNQFFSVAGVGEGNYGSGPISFGQAAPNPLSYLVASDCYSERCVSISPPVIPLFTPPSPVCAGGGVPALPTTSNNLPPITGTWSGPVSNTTSGVYTFTPNVGQCASTTTLGVSVNPLPATGLIFHE